MRTLGGQGEKIFDDFPKLEGIRVSRKGWAKRDDFEELPSGQRYKGQKFREDNMFVYYDQLRDMDDFFSSEINHII